MSEKPKPITSEKIPGTNIPDITKAQSEDPAQKKWMARVAVTTAVLATLASLASMFATNHLNMAMISTIEASNQWAFFQAKSVKLNVLESKMELLPALGKEVAAADTAKAAEYKTDKDKIEKDARKNEAAAADHRKRQATLSRASTCFQVAIALCAVALLVRKNAFWLLSIVLGLGGVVFFALGMLPG